MLNGEDALMMLPNALRKSWIYQVLPFMANQNTSSIGNKIPDRKFYLSADNDFFCQIGNLKL